MAEMDALFFKPFVDGTLQTLKVQCTTEATTGKPFFKNKGEQAEVDIAGIIGLTSDKFSGSVSICFPKNVFLAIMSKMLGENFTEINADLESGAAELLNIIFGLAKAKLNDAGHTIQKAIPSVVTGKNLKTSASSSAPVIVLPFSTKDGNFYMEICVENRSLS